MSHGTRLTISHPDFSAATSSPVSTEHASDTRKRFLDGMTASWSAIMEAQGLTASLRAYHDEEGVHLFVTHEHGVQQAEMVVGSVIAATSIAAVEANRGAETVVAAYGFAIERVVNDEWAELLVWWPESTEAGPT